MKINQSIITDIKTIILNSRDIAIRAVDTERVRMYWRIGQRIFVEEQQEKDRADYGSQLLIALGSSLSIRQLERYRQFYRTFPIASAIRTQLGWPHYKMLRALIAQTKEIFIWQKP